MKLISKFLFSWFIAPIINYRYQRLIKSYTQCEEQQDKILEQILNRLTLTEYGSEFKINREMSYHEFKNQVPLVEYKDIEEYIQTEKNQKQAILLNPSAMKWEVTSGSSSSQKHIPYNKYALRDFRDLIIYWIGDILQSESDIHPNKIFFSLSAHLTKENQSDIKDDSDYLPWYFRLFFKDFILVPSNIQKIKDTDQFNIYLCAHLLADKDLDTLFIWSPTYILSLLQFIQDHQSKILKVIADEQFIFNEKTYPLKIKNKREILAIRDIIFRKRWLHIKYISCWTEGSAQFFLNEMKGYFPKAQIQGKGLISTEAPLTFPSDKAGGYLPLVDNIFYEFIDEDSQVKRLHELQVGKKYELVISNRSGLVRYKMCDILEVTSIFNTTPCLRFIERAELSSDLTGEKLTSHLIQEALDNIKANIKAFFVPIIAHPSYYTLISDEDISIDDIDQALQKNYHYQESRKLNQLAQIKFYKVNNIVTSFNELKQKQGMKLGNIKFQNLITKPMTEQEINEALNK